MTPFRPVVAASVLALSACATTQDRPLRDPLIEANYAAADQLHSILAGAPGTQQPIVVIAPKALEAPVHTFPLGRMIGELLSSRLAQAGHPVVAFTPKHPPEPYPMSSARYALWPEIRDYATQHNAQAVVTGTYAVGAHSVYVSLKAVRPSDDAVIAAHDYTLPLTHNISHLLGTPRGFYW
jgi:FlgO protein